jgi:hypothetical protein
MLGRLILSWPLALYNGVVNFLSDIIGIRITSVGPKLTEIGYFS